MAIVDLRPDQPNQLFLPQPPEAVTPFSISQPDSDPVMVSYGTSRALDTYFGGALNARHSAARYINTKTKDFLAWTRMGLFSQFDSRASLDRSGYNRMIQGVRTAAVLGRSERAAQSFNHAALVFNIMPESSFRDVRPGAEMDLTPPKTPVDYLDRIDELAFQLARVARFEIKPNVDIAKDTPLLRTVAFFKLGEDLGHLAVGANN
jgi:hypothetical protein